jgi:ubiquinone/menaquinone biosynthesis C-methylase UbiE
LTTRRYIEGTKSTGDHLSFYRDRVLPHLIDFGMRQHTLDPCRQRVTAAAAGRVLEVGVGSGLNLRLYPAPVSSVIAIDPSPQLLIKARARTSTARTAIALVRSAAEHLPFASSSFDTVVVTWTLCSVSDVSAALAEMRRVLKGGGRLLFAEHGWSPERPVQRWQTRLTPLWKRIAGGCHLDRPVRQLVEDAGFVIVHIDNHYLAGPKPLTYMYEGAAVRPPS